MCSYTQFRTKHRIKGVDCRNCYTEAFKIAHARKTCLCFLEANKQGEKLLTTILRYFKRVVNFSMWLINNNNNKNNNNNN